MCSICKNIEAKGESITYVTKTHGIDTWRLCPLCMLKILKFVSISNPDELIKAIKLVLNGVSI